MPVKPSVATGALVLLAALALALAPALSLYAAEPAADLILVGGRVATVDERFSVHEALAVTQGRVVEVGPTAALLQRRGPRTEVIDLQGRLVVPGLIDTHAHPIDASLTEFHHAIPSLDRIEQVLDYISERARSVPAGQWIEIRQVFITRLAEQRYPTRAELGRVAPSHPVLFATGPDASLNSLALQLSGIDRDFKVTDGGTGFAEKDPATGEPTGILRNCTRYVKVSSTTSPPTRAERLARLRQLFADYNSVGLTAVCDRDASVQDLETYRDLKSAGPPTMRVSISQHIDSIGAVATIEDSIRRVADDPLFKERDPWIRLIGVKTYLDGGMLTGSAYMREPWGVSTIYSIRDPAYRGVRFIPPERLVPMVRAAVSVGLQFTAHSVGDGAVHALLDAYAEVDRELPIRASRPCISHSNFMSREAIDQAARLGVMVDLQPAWLYLDAHTLVRQFGYDRLRYFQPLHSLFAAGVVACGGSDHMQKIGSLRSVNPYNPFLGMATAITRKAKNHPEPLHPEESLTRAEALRFYTLNGARLLGRADELGSLEPGKRADFAILDTDLLTCPDDRIAQTKVVATYVEGRRVHGSSTVAP